MTKLNVVNTFDTSQLDKTIVTKIAPLTDFINQHVSEVVRAVRNGLSLGDNVNGAFIQVDATHDTWINVAKPANLSIVGVVPLAVQGDVYTGFGYRYNDTGKLQIKFLFQTTTKPTPANPPNTPSNFTVSVFAFGQ